MKTLIRSWICLGFASMLILLTALESTQAQGDAAPKSAPIVQVQGEARVQLQPGETMDMARHRALLQAQVNALEKAFGKAITQANVTDIQNVNQGQQAQTTTRFLSMADAFVNGDWLRTTHERYETFHEAEAPKNPKKSGGAGQIQESDIWIRAEVRGEARALNTQPLGVELSALNCPDASCVAHRFVHGERLYLRLKSALPGFVNAWLQDGETVYQLLPYTLTPDSLKGGIPVESQRPYILFSTRPEHNHMPDPYFQEDELVLLATQPLALHRIYVMISPYPLSRPSTTWVEANSLGIQPPPMLGRTAFLDWLGRSRSADPNLHLRIFDITLAGQNTNVIYDSADR